MKKTIHENKIQLLGAVIKVNLVYEAPDGMLTSFYGVDAESPLMQSETLRSVLRKGIRTQDIPFMYRAEHKCYYAALHAGDGILFMGPMCHEKLRKIELRQMYREFGVGGEDLPELPAFTLPEMRNMVLLTNLILENDTPGNGKLLHLNQLITGGVESEKADQTKFLLTRCSRLTKMRQIFLSGRTERPGGSVTAPPSVCSWKIRTMRISLMR